MILRSCLLFVAMSVSALEPPQTISDMQDLLVSWNLDAAFASPFRKFKVDGDVFMDLQPADFEQNPHDFPNARDYHWRKLMRLRQQFVSTVDVNVPVVSRHLTESKIDFSQYSGVDIRKSKSKVAFSNDGAILYHDDPVGLLKLKGDLAISGSLNVGGQSLAKLVTSICEKTIDTAITSGKIGTMKYLDLGIEKSFSCVGKDQTYVVPDGVGKIVFDLHGAAGGGSNAEGAKSPGGDGGHTVGSLIVTPGQVITIQVGCGGTYGTKKADHPRPYPSGGLPGYRDGYFSGAGGGRSAVIVQGEYVLIAGGGGGAAGAGCGGKLSDGGNGGGTVGERGYCSYDITAKGCLVDGTYQNGGVAGKSDGTQGMKLSGADSSQQQFNGNDKGNAAGGGGDGWFGGGAGGTYTGTGAKNKIEGVDIQPHWHCGGGGGAGYVNSKLAFEAATLVGGGAKGVAGAKGSDGNVRLKLFAPAQGGSSTDASFSFVGKGFCIGSGVDQRQATSVKRAPISKWMPSQLNVKKGTALTKDGSCWGIGWNDLPNANERGKTACERCLNSVEGRSEYKGQQCVPVKPFKDGNGNLISCERPGTAEKLTKDDTCKSPENPPAPACEKACQSNPLCHGYVQGPYGAKKFSTSKKLTWSEAVKFCIDKGGTLASRGNICPNSKPGDARETEALWVPVSDGSKPEYMYYGKDYPNVSGDTKNLYACELHSEWPAHKGAFPTWADNHQNDNLKSNRVYCSMDEGCALITSTINPEIKGSDSSQNHRCFVKNVKNDEDFSMKKPETKSFKCTGKDQSIMIPKGVKYISAELKGAGGGSSDAEGRVTKGGQGGFTSGLFEVQALAKLSVEVGCGGTSGPTKDKHIRAYPNGGLPGYRTGYISGGGGGRSAVKLDNDYILIAGGGGGSGGWGCGGSQTSTRHTEGGIGGGMAGSDGTCTCGTVAGKGGNQDGEGSGPKLGGQDAPQTQFGQGGCSGSVCNAAGGGGDGWYGGKHGGLHCGGGGGSGYIAKNVLSSKTTQGGGAEGGAAQPGGRPGNHGSVVITLHYTKPKGCDEDFAFNNCAEIAQNGCKNGEYKLRSCSSTDRSNCIDWRTTCNDGFTLIGYLAKNTKTKNRFDVYTKWPKENPSRGSGSTFLYQGPIQNLQLTERISVLEGVKCTGAEALSNNCKWVHNSETCNSDCIHRIRQTYGYQYTGDGVANNKRPPCGTGKTGGTVRAGCSAYKTTSRTVLGWQQDMHGTTHCWMGRGSCCSDAGGTGGCGGDSSGKYHGMLWVKPE